MGEFQVKLIILQSNRNGVTSMNIVIAILSPGAMGSAIAQRLVERGARVLTSLDGRSAATVARARAARMEDVSPETITTADLILSIVPPGQAVALANSLVGGSLPLLLSKFKKSIPDMYPKAYRWFAEMREIAAFLGEDKAAAMIFEGAAQLYERLATDIANEGKERGTLDGFFHSK
jgi:hypothetical protein